MYLEVTSYLLTVLTFSVGFLSTRRHAHFDVLSKDIADRSWKIRQALNLGQDLGPRDLAEDIVAVKVDPDSVSTFARMVNAFFFISACAVAGIGLFEPQPVHEAALLALVLLSTALVFALGEFDVRWMASKERDLARDTALGQLAVVDRALRSGEGRTATDEIARIRETYPQWAFGRELEFALAATEMGFEVAGTPMELLEAGGSLYAAPLLAAEHQLQRGNPIGALQDFHIIAPRSSTSRTVDKLNIVIGFTVGLPRTVFTEPAITSRWFSEPGGLELGLHSLPAVKRATESLRDFGSGMSLAEWMAGQVVSPPLIIAQAATAESSELSALMVTATEPMFAGALNSLGIVCLARGNDTDALQIFEAAIRLRPNSSTSHWGRAVACARRGWHDAAEESLLRADSLDPSSPHIITMTRMVLEGRQPLAADREREVAENAWESLQLALLGYRPEAVHMPAGARGELTQLLLASALENSAVKA